MISIVAPSWNSLEYLKIFYNSLKKNLKIPYELIIHNNGSSDKTENWLITKNIKYTKSEKNEGFCAVNYAIRQAKYDYILVSNVDMYYLQGFDLILLNKINEFKRAKIKDFTISCRLIEPIPGNPEYFYFDAGNDYSNFDEKKLLNWYQNTKPKYEFDTFQFSHPILFPKITGEEVGFFDMNYFPGSTSDYDFGKALYEKGCRNFCLVKEAQVYHFSNKTFSKLPSEIRNKNGHDVFIKKWGIHPEEFRKQIGIKNKFEMVK